MTHEYLKERGAIEQRVPTCVQDIFSFDMIVLKNSTWSKRQGRAFYRDEAKAREHKHYSLLNTPVASKMDDYSPVDLTRRLAKSFPFGLRAQVQAFISLAHQ